MISKSIPLALHDSALHNALDALGDRLECSLGIRLDNLTEALQPRLQGNWSQEAASSLSFRGRSVDDALSTTVVPMSSSGQPKHVGFASEPSQEPMYQLSDPSTAGSIASIDLRSQKKMHKPPSGMSGMLDSDLEFKSLSVLSMSKRSADHLGTASTVSKKIHVRDIWEKIDDGNSDGGMVISECSFAPGINREESETSLGYRSSETEHIESMLKSKPCYILRPSCIHRLGWDVFGIALIGYDMVMIPYNMAFIPVEENPSLGFTIMFWLALTFWSLDIILAFITGYYDNGQEELRLARIARRYIKTWLALDVLVVGSDWFNFWVGGGSQGRGIAMARMSKTIRVLRIMRSFRLLRLMKMREIIEHVQDHITSENLNIIITMVKLTVFVLSINHFIACAWYAISCQEQSSNIIVPWVEYHDLASREVAYKYFTAMHWSLTQFTPASMEVVPRTLAERAFAVVVLVFALLVFSSFVSSITAAMTKLRSLHGIFDKNVSLLRRYLRARNIPHDLSFRILRYVEHQLLVRKQEIQESDVHLLKILSKPLQMEMVEQTYKPILAEHPFFKCYGMQDRNAMKQLCNHAVSCVSLSVGDKLFTEGASDTQMFFVVKGRIHYTETRNLTAPKSVKPGGWLGEAALWTDWVHLGTATAVLNSEVLAVNTDSFSKVTNTHRKVVRQTAHYARMFVDKINACFDAEGGFLTDVWNSSEEEEVLVEAAATAFPELYDAFANVRITRSSTQNAEKLQQGFLKVFNSKCQHIVGASLGFIGSDTNHRLTKSNDGRSSSCKGDEDLSFSECERDANMQESTSGQSSLRPVSLSSPYFMKQSSSKLVDM